MNDPLEINALGDHRPCRHCGYQQCACVIDVSNCGGQTLDPPCGSCARCMNKAFPGLIKHEPLDVLGLDQEVLGYNEVSYTKPVRYTDPTLSPDAQQIDACMHGPRCLCGHVRLDHWGPCQFKGCKCQKFNKA